MNAKKNFGIGAGLAAVIFFLPPSMQQTVFGILAVPILAVAAVLTALFGSRGWGTQLYNWAFVGGAPTRALRRLALVLAAFMAVMVLAVYFGGTWFVALVAAILGIASLILLRAANQVPGTMLWGFAGRAQDALRTLTVGLLFIAILALAAGEHILPMIPFTGWVMIALLALILSAMGNGSANAQWVMKSAAIVLVVATLIPMLIGSSMNPVRAGVKALMFAMIDQSAASLESAAVDTDRETVPDRADVMQTRAKVISRASVYTAKFQMVDDKEVAIEKAHARDDEGHKLYLEPGRLVTTTLVQPKVYFANEALLEVYLPDDDGEFVMSDQRYFVAERFLALQKRVNHNTKTTGWSDAATWATPKLLIIWGAAALLIVAIVYWPKSKNQESDSATQGGH